MRKVIKIEQKKKKYLSLIAAMITALTMGGCSNSYEEPVVTQEPKKATATPMSTDIIEKTPIPTLITDEQLLNYKNNFNLIMQKYPDAVVEKSVLAGRLALRVSVINERGLTTGYYDAKTYEELIPIGIYNIVSETPIKFGNKNLLLTGESVFNEENNIIVFNSSILDADTFEVLITKFGRYNEYFEDKDEEILLEHEYVIHKEDSIYTYYTVLDSETWAPISELSSDYEYVNGKLILDDISNQNTTEINNPTLLKR